MPWEVVKIDKPPRKRGRPPIGEKAAEGSGFAVSPRVAAVVRELRDEMQASLGMDLSLAETVRHLVIFYRQHQKGGQP